MTVLTGAIEIPRMIPARPLDEHGWADKNPLKPADPVMGVIQEMLPGPQPDGDFGIWDPGQARRGVAYLEDAVNPGDVLKWQDAIWRVLDTRKTRDPRGTGQLDCFICQVEQVVGVIM